MISVMKKAENKKTKMKGKKDENTNNDPQNTI
jgi:hypothetical protein